MIQLLKPKNIIMIDIVIDTNALISFLDTADKWKPVIDSIFKRLQKNSINIIVTDIVINEAINVLCKRFENKKKENEIPSLIQKVDALYNEESITWISEEIKIYHNSILNLLKTNNGLLNYNDCFLISFMQKNSIKYIISFDIDFDQIDGIKRIYNAEFAL